MSPLRWVAVKPICEAIGLDRKAQQERLETNPQFKWGVIPLVGNDGKQREMVCLLVDQLNGWLYTINANKVKPAARERLLTYQRECQQVLFQHFMPLGGTQGELRNLVAHLGALQVEMRGGFTALREEIRTLHTLVNLAWSDTDEAEIRALVEQASAETGWDRRAIVGHVRQTLGTSSVYQTHVPLQVKNVLRNLLGRGVFGVVGEGT